VSNVVSVPPELATFIQSPNAQTLLIRGPPGSGKTMLALALLQAFPGRRVYVSLRVTRTALYAQFPWLSTVPPEDFEVVDSAEETSHAPGRTQLKHKELVLSRPEEAKELEEFHWLPKSVQSAWSLSDDQRPTMVVLDSWDAIIDQYFEHVDSGGGPVLSRPEVERLLVGRMLKNSNLALILVLERDSPSILDYIVHGIVETSRRLVDGRLERWLSLPKLRGTPIPVDTYPFTLAGGRFTAITPSQPRDFTFQSAVPDPEPGALGQWPGSTDYASAFGRLIPGQVTIIELDSAVPREVPGILAAPMLIQAIAGGGRGLFFSAPTLAPETMFSLGSEMIKKYGVSPRMRVMTTVPLADGPAKRSGLFMPFRWSATTPSVPVLDDSEFLRTPSAECGPSLFTAYLSGIHAAAEVAGVPIGHGFLAALVAAHFPVSPVHLLLFAREGDPSIDILSPISDVLIRVRYTNGRVFLTGHRPYSAPLLLSYDDGSEPYHLTPII
jgi:KaiC/GvpD/RAD55 family RecA-like ATPase